jgi:hypothetical protein
VAMKGLRLCLPLKWRRNAGGGMHGGLTVAEDLLPMSVHIQGPLSRRAVSLAKQPTVVYDTIPSRIPG